MKSGEHIFQLIQNAFGVYARDAGIAVRAYARSMQGTGAAGHIELDDAVLLTRGEEAPFTAGRAEHGESWGLYGSGEVHGT